MIHGRYNCVRKLWEGLEDFHLRELDEIVISFMNWFPFFTLPTLFISLEFLFAKLLSFFFFS